MITPHGGSPRPPVTGASSVDRTSPLRWSVYESVHLPPHADDIANENGCPIQHFLFGLSVQRELGGELFEFRGAFVARRGSEVCNSRADPLVLFEHPGQLSFERVRHG